MKRVQIALRDGRKLPTTSERNTADVARKSLVTADDIPAGTILTAELVVVCHPGTGLQPALREKLLGRCTAKALIDGQLFSWEDIA